MCSLGTMQSDISCDETRSGLYPARLPRTRTCLSGKLVYGEPPGVPDGSFTLDCAIQNISDSGAKVIIAEHQFLPPKLYLIAVRFCVAYYATVVWQEYPARGLKFSQIYPLNAQPHPPNDGLPSELKYLRALWVNLDSRSGCAN